MNQPRKTSVTSISVISVFAALLSACSSDDKAVTDRDTTASASYRVTFTTMWNAEKFPTNFPAGSHFSGLVGGTHNEQVIFWESGQLASAGIESMAETGAQGTLAGEVAEAKAAGTAQFVLSGPGAAAQDSVSFEFDINPEYAQLSLVSMVAPSPDWFVGVQNLSLYDAAKNDWKPLVTVDLAVYDAGTDNGLRFVAADSDTQPANGIGRLSSSSEDTDFLDGTGAAGEFIAKFTFERIK